MSTEGTLARLFPLQALVTAEELANAPASFNTLPIKGGGPALKGFQYRIQVGTSLGTALGTAASRACTAACRASVPTQL